MPREQKVGFTILILIVGFAGAFCFRRDLQQTAALPTLQDEREINQLIAEYRLRPYLPGIDTAESTDSQHQLKQYLAINDHSDQKKSLGNQEVPKPIQSTTPRTVFTENVQKNLRDKDAPSKKKVVSVKLPGKLQTDRQSAEFVTHIVQPGETLSGIAQKYLGSASRFNEIYETNRDVLSGPDQLKPKMKLVIPLNGDKIQPEVIKEARVPEQNKVSNKEKKAKGTTREKKEQAVLADSASGKKTDRKKLFVPARRSPFSSSLIEQPSTAKLSHDEKSTREKKMAKKMNHRNIK